MATPATSAPHPGKKAFSFNSCNQCHSAGSLAISAAQITAKYQGQQGAYGYLLSEFRKGGFDKGKISHLKLELRDGELENMMEWLVGSRDTSGFTASQDNSSAKNGSSNSESKQKSNDGEATNYSGTPCVSEFTSMCAIYNDNSGSCRRGKNMESKIRSDMGTTSAGAHEILKEAQRTLLMNEDDLGSGALAFAKYRACYAKAIIAQ